MLKHHEGVKNKPYFVSGSHLDNRWGHVLYQEQIKLPMVRKKGYSGKIRKEFSMKIEDFRIWTMDEIDDLLTKDLENFTRGVLSPH
jgi:hypothetical protein